MNFGTLGLTRMRTSPFYRCPVNKCFVVGGLPCCKGNGLNMTLCRPAHDTLLSNRDKETLNLDTNYITTSDNLVEKMIYVPLCHNQL